MLKSSLLLLGQPQVCPSCIHTHSCARSSGDTWTLLTSIFSTAGDEAWVVETAPAAPVKEDFYPLVQPAVAETSMKNNSFNPVRYWGNLSPWWSVGGAWGLPDASAMVPTGCELTQVHILHRHGARYPTSGSASSEFAAKIHAAATSSGFKASGPLAFLNTWTYKLGAELLTPFGREQL